MRRILILVGLPLIGLLAMPAVFLVLNWAFPFPLETLSRPPSVVVEDRDGRPLRAFLATDQQWRFPVKLTEVPAEFCQVVIASEDRWFYWHPGVNPFSIIRAAYTNLRAGGVVSGASTLAMQISRLAQPRPRTYGAKCIEAFRALQLEWVFTKSYQLELYLNLAPYGGNLEGVGAASWFYFGKKPAQLSLGEMALLAALPRSPSQYDPTRNRNNAARVRDNVLELLRARELFSDSRIEASLKEPIPDRRRPTPFEAPHLSYLALQLRQGYPRIRTTIDLRSQTIAEELVTSRMPSLRNHGIGNAAVVVISNRDQTLSVLVGSAGFTENVYQGQVNGAISLRSPGSTLKPFLFIRALERGLIVPESYLLDIPTDFAGYAPENYDGEYRGRVTARQALIQSLNASSVRLLARVGLDDLLGMLRDGGLSTLNRSADHYGLSLILGGGEITLLELAGIYCSLARGGLRRPVRMFLGDETTAERRLFSREAAHFVTQALTDLQRPDLPKSWHMARDVPEIAWKTGTSYGHRDAWAVGFSDTHTIGVWVGNFDGRPCEGISGAQHAAPLLFDLFRGLERDGAQLPRPQGLEISDIEVCSLSHELPGPFCGDRKVLSHIPGKSKIGRCTYHRKAFVDTETGELLAGDCLGNRPYRSAILTVYPSELVAWRQTEGQPLPKLPAVAHSCGSFPASEGPAILSPQDETRYLIGRDLNRGYQRVALAARTGPHAKKLYWYQDGILRHTIEPGEKVFVELEEGRHQLVVVDDLGLSDSLVYHVDNP